MCGKQIAAAFVDPKQSGIEIVQAIGRTIRRAAGKEKATIIIPLFMRPGDDANSVMEDSAFRTVRNVIRALSEVDERFAEEINAYRLHLGGRRTLRRPRLERVHFDLPENWDADKVGRFKESIGDEIVRFGLSAEGWLLVAKRLAATGPTRPLLPGPGWLQKYGYAAMSVAMYERPDMPWPPQDKKRWSKETFRSFANALVQHHGHIPRGLREIKPYGAKLEVAMRKHPDWFDDMPREEKRKRSPEEWGPEIMEKAGEAGALPSPTQLRKQGLSGMALVVRNNPGLYGDIPQQKECGRTVVEWAEEARRRKESNGGKKLSREQIGRGGMYKAEREHPDMFIDYIEEKRRKSPEEMVPEAWRLAAEYGGKLPGPQRLRNDGHQQVDTAMRARPDLPWPPQDKRAYWRGAASKAHSKEYAKAYAASDKGKAARARYLARKG